VTPKEPLEIRDLQTPKPRGSQVLVKVQSSGVCHSDIHLWDGGYTGPGNEFLKTTDRGVKYPLTPGHEIAGIISELGEDAKETFKNERSVLIRLERRNESKTGDLVLRDKSNPDPSDPFGAGGV
jgi:propanol-preferring alcohol dehydrogenase